MTTREMPEAEVEITVDLVRAILADQCPDLAHADLTHLAHGWDNESFRLGDSQVARFPRRRLAAELVVNEARWVPTFADTLPLPVPAPSFLGEPGRGYPWRWSIAPWIPGESAATIADLDLDLCARQLGGFLRALHRPAPGDAPINPYRGVPLADRDEAMRRRITSLEHVVDAPLVTHLWETSVALAPHREAPVWLHGDLHPHNLVASDRRLSGVVDFGDVTAGDPATDLAVAWMMFDSPRRAVMFDAYGGVDEACHDRARGWALALSLAYLANSADNPTMHQIGETTYAAAVAGG